MCAAGSPGSSTASSREGRGDADVTAPTTRLGFERQVRDALAHLHDPGHLQAHPLTRFLLAKTSLRASSLGRALRQAILDAVESLRPGVESPLVVSHALRSYQILNLRHVEALEVSQVLDRLSLSQSLYYVELQRAIEGLSAVLWEMWGVDATGGVPGRRSERATPDGGVGPVA